MSDEDHSDMRLKCNDPDKVLSLTMKNGKDILVPASNPLNLVLRYNLSGAPLIEKLKNIFHSSLSENPEEL